MNVRKRGLALLMCICMIFTLLPFSAFADGTSEPDVVYGTYDENGTWTQDANAKDTVTCKTEGDNTLSLTKTAKRTADNTYDITLKVVSTQTETTTKPGSAATVLVMDVSGSMDICATCNNSEQQSDWNGNYWFEHSKDCNTEKTGIVEYSETRLKAAKDAAYDFILSYSGAELVDGKVTGLKDNADDGLGRYVSVVSFSTGSSVACEWKDVSTVAGYDAVKAAIDGLNADGGTNLDAGLRTANDKFNYKAVKSIKAKNVIALTDGMPTFYVGGDSDGNHGSYGCPDTNEATAKSATALKASASVYTVCFGASEDKCWEKDSAHRWIDHTFWIDVKEKHPTDGPKVGDFLRKSIATSETGKTYAYNANNTKELMAAFKAITSSITEGIKTGTVLDPMGDHITVTNKPDNFVKTPKGYKWELGEPDSTVTENGKTTYTYTLTYTVTFDPNFGDFDENSYYAANKETTFTAGGKVYNFNVPGVKGTAPKYKVTYEFEGNYPDSVKVPASEQHKAGETVTMPEINAPEGWIFNGWKYDSEPVTSVEMPAGDITIIGTFTEQKAYTVKYLLKDTDISVKDADTGTKNVGESVEATAPDLPGYTFAGTDADKNQTITVVSDASNNVITFYYYKNVTVTANDDTKVYGDNNPAAFGATVTGTRDNETVVYTVGRQAGEDVGNYAITPTGDEIQGYYKVEYKTGSFEITARPVTLTGESDTRTYTGQEIELTNIEQSGLLDGHTFSGVRYSAKGTDARTEPYPGEFSDKENLVIKDAADNDVTHNYNVEYKTGALTINPRPLTITGVGYPSITKPYITSGYDLHGYDYNKAAIDAEGKDNGIGLIDGHTISGITYTLAGKEVNTEQGYKGVFSGEVVIKAGNNDVTANYAITLLESKLYIYGVEQGMATIHAVKVLDNATVNTADRFKFKLVNVNDENDSVEVGNDAYGHITFNLSYDEEGTYIYKLSEVVGDEAATINYDKSVYYVKVVVTLNEQTKTYDAEVSYYMDAACKHELPNNSIPGFNNTTKPGSLTISKTVSGNAASTTKEFTFKVMLLQNANMLEGEVTYGNVKFTNGEATIKLKHNESVTITGIPAGLNYGVTESDNNGYTVTVNGENTTLATGTIAAGKTSTAAFKNTKNYVYPVNPPIMDEIIVEITGNSDSVVYDGTEHSVKDYTVKISDPRYTEADFTFTGKAEASGVNAGTYEMGLKAEQFKNTNARFTNVKFVIKADGVLTITPKELIITAGSKTEYGPTPVTCDEWTVSGLAAGDKVESVKITGIQSVPGSSPNVPSDAVIKNAKGEDVTKNYAIKYVNGTLTMLEVLNKEDHFNYIIGTPEGLSLPTANVTRAEVATIFFRLMTDDARAKFDSLDNNFSDVAKGQWYNRAISTLANAGIIKGDPAGTYRPGDAITRAEMAAIIARFGDFKEGGKTFNDISGHWAQKYIELAASNGWINGNPDGTFKPNNNITRAETVAMINRVLDRQTKDVSDLLPVSQMTNWSDNMDTAKWYYRDMQEATNNHKAERVGNSIYEKWTEKLPDIDWASYQI